MNLRNFPRAKVSVPIAVILVVVTAAVVLGLSYLLFHDKTPATKDNAPATAGASNVALPPSGIKYPSEWNEATEISSNEKQAGVLSIASRQKSNSRMILRGVKGDLPKDFNITALPADVVDNLQKNVQGFNLKEKRTVKLDNSDAVKIDYDQINSADQSIRHYSMYIVPTSKTTYYITYSYSDVSIGSFDKDIVAINHAIVDYIQHR